MNYMDVCGQGADATIVAGVKIAVDGKVLGAGR